MVKTVDMGVVNKVCNRIADHTIFFMIPCFILMVLMLIVIPTSSKDLRSLYTVPLFIMCLLCGILMGSYYVKTHIRKETLFVEVT